MLLMSYKGDAAKSIAQYNIFENTKTIESLNKDELKFEVEQWRRIWDYIPTEIQAILSQIGQQVIVFKRDGGYFDGFFLGFDCTVNNYIFKTTERIRSQVDKKFFIYETQSKVPKSNVIDFKFVKGTYEDTPDPYAIPSQDEITSGGENVNP